MACPCDTVFERVRGLIREIARIIMDFHNENCSVCWDEQCLTMKNNVLEAIFSIRGGALELESLTNPASGVTAGNRMTGDPEPMSVSCTVSDDLGLAKPALEATVRYACGNVQRSSVLRLYPDLPFVEIRHFTEKTLDSVLKPILTIPMLSRHTKLTAVTLYDQTDANDELATTYERMLYPSYQERLPTGNLFFGRDLVSGLSVITARDVPFRHQHGADCAAKLHGTTLTLYSPGFSDAAPCQLYGCTVGLAEGDPYAAYKKYYRAAYLGENKLTVMSNTWGDRSRDEALCESFLLREIDCAEKIGVDVVQIDDGWQHGTTKNSSKAGEIGGVWEGYYAFDPNFWTVNPDHFPNGLEPIAETALARGIELGLWFSPDSSKEFGNWRKDADTVLGLHRKYGVKFFKIDGVNFTSKQAEKNFFRFLRAVTEESDGKVRLNLDITAQRRPGYLFGKAYGTLFVENRYTDWGNYYPHNTLRNLWTLSRYFPTEKFQFELLNPDRNPQVYGDDPFAPKHYDIDYEFASVMLANPLVWMEMCHLSPENTEKLAKLVSIWRTVRGELRRANVTPIGQQPDGLSFPGFAADCGDHGYLILFREAAEADFFDYAVGFDAKSFEVLASNTDAAVTASGNGTVHAVFGKKRAYVLVRYQK